jgi:hypothetical protein
MAHHCSIQKQAAAACQAQGEHTERAFGVLDWPADQMEYHELRKSKTR